jgi:hypothetical protein
MIVPEHFLRYRWVIRLPAKISAQQSMEQAAWANMTRMANNHKKMSTLIWDASALVADAFMQNKGLQSCFAFLSIAGDSIPGLGGMVCDSMVQSITNSPDA